MWWSGLSNCVASEEAVVDPADVERGDDVGQGRRTVSHSGNPFTPRTGGAQPGKRQDEATATRR